MTMMTTGTHNNSNNKLIKTEKNNLTNPNLESERDLKTI